MNKFFFYKKIPSFIFDKIYNKIKKVNHNGVDFFFHIPNEITLYRAETFSNKEPNTLKYNFDRDSVFWDIGANVGLYSIYAAKISNLPRTKFIKIDVDGIEHLISSGMSSILEDAEEILIELSNIFTEKIDISSKILSDNGFVLIEKFIEDDLTILTNQIWKKSVL
jgi:hypothetical protein